MKWFQKLSYNLYWKYLHQKSAPTLPRLRARYLKAGACYFWVDAYG